MSRIFLNALLQVKNVLYKCIVNVRFFHWKDSIVYIAFSVKQNGINILSSIEIFVPCFCQRHYSKCPLYAIFLCFKHCWESLMYHFYWIGRGN